MFLMRYTMLIVECLARHPEASLPEYKQVLKRHRKRLMPTMTQLEDIKPHIEESYNEWMKIRAARREATRDSRPSSSSSSQYARHAARDAALSWNHRSPATILDPSQHQNLAVNLANREMDRRRRRAKGLPESDTDQWHRDAKVQDRTMRPASRSSAGTSAPVDPRYMNDDELRRQMEATRRQLDRHDPYNDDTQEDPSPVTYNYPSIRKSSPRRYQYSGAPIPPSEGQSRPPRPPKEFVERSLPIIQRPPPRPEKEPMEHDFSRPRIRESLSPGPSELPTPPPKTLPVPEKQERVTFKPAAYLENGEPLRPIFLPRVLRSKFLKIAEDNTRKGLELCGILCGTLANNALFVTCLLIPEQKCTENTCETENEWSISQYCDEHDLIVMGWIHTHPTQTCFMSSRDVHTQSGYQVMMPESIAIVLSPKFEPS